MVAQWLSLWVTELKVREIHAPALPRYHYFKALSKALSV